MKALSAAGTYILLGLLLSWGILLTTRGSYALLIGGVVFYAILLGTLGCLPKKSH